MMRTTARRISEGQALRDVLRERGIGLQELARRTKIADPASKGVSFQLLGFLTQDSRASRHARETCSVPTALLVEDTLGVARGTLFEVIEAPSRSDPQPTWDDLKNVSGQ